MRNKKSNVGAAAVAVVALGIVAAGAYGAWHLQRWFNYEFGYGSQVQSEICVMLKPEALKNPEDC